MTAFRLMDEIGLLIRVAERVPVLIFLAAALVVSLIIREL